MSVAAPRTDRLESYESRTDRPLLTLAVCFVAGYATEIIVTDLYRPAHRALEAASWLVWGVFAADLVVRTWLSERPGRYLLTHPVDVVVVLLPALRVLRVFSAGQTMLSRGGRLSLLRSTQAIVTTACVLVLIAALAELDAERGAPGSHIITFGDALWWAATTVTTVGYGATFPVTSTGRIVAAALMLVGISLVGLVTATVAAWFVAQTRTAVQEEDAGLAERLTRIEAALAEILRSSGVPVPAARRPGPSRDRGRRCPRGAVSSVAGLDTRRVGMFGHSFGGATAGPVSTTPATTGSWTWAAGLDVRIGVTCTSRAGRAAEITSR